MNRRVALVGTLLLLALAACSTHRSSLRAEDGGELLWAVDERQAFNAANSALAEVFPSEPVFDLDGPVMGFSVRRRFGSDWYNTMVRVFAATGRDSSAREIYGYYYEVSGEGTYFSGPSGDSEVFQGVWRRLSGISKPAKVTGAARAEYRLARDRWRLKPEQAGTQAAQPPAMDAKARLEYLEDLQRRKLITDEEYRVKRQQVVDSL
jgi:hypothetical protein